MNRIKLTLLALVPLAMFGQSKLSPYTSQFLEAYGKKQLTESAEKQFPLLKSVKASTDAKIPAFIHLSDASAVAQLEAAGIKVNTVAGKIVTAHIPMSKLDAVAAIKAVTYIEMGTPVRKLMDVSRAAANVDKSLEGVDLPQAYTGKGVVVGVIDGGVEYGHVNFYDSEGKELRIKRVWDQNKSTGTAPEGFDYGAEYKTEDDILKAKFDMRETHGSHVMGMAAGSFKDSKHDYRGVAPDADIVFVSFNQNDLTGILDGVKYIFKYADSVNKPCVINVSLGTHTGPHDGTSSFDTAVSELVGPGKILVGANGNENGEKLHLSRTFNATEEHPDTLRTFIKFANTYYGPYAARIDVWGEQNTDYSVVPVVYDAANSKILKELEPFTPGKEAATKKYTLTASTVGITGEMEITGSVSPLNNKPNALVFFNFRSVSTQYRLGFYVIGRSKGTVHMWNDLYTYSSFDSYNVKGWESGNSDYAAGEIGGTGKRTISVGAYVTRNRVTGLGSTGETLNDLASFSSFGPTADERMKPDISAPGSFIISSYSNYLNDPYGQYPAPAYTVAWNGNSYDFGYLQGTSMASPFVAGVMATWLQANPELTPEEAKDILKATAITDKYTGEIAGKGDNKWGYGKVDAWNGLKALLKNSGVTAPATDGNSILVRQEGKTLSLLFTQPSETATVAVYDLNGRLVNRSDFSSVIAGDEHMIDLGNAVSGIYVLRATDSNTTLSQKLIIR